VKEEKKEEVKKMTSFSCPGTIRIKEPVPEFFECPSCGIEVEIWTHEFSRKCDNCGIEVFKDQTPSCIEWCKYGKECVGEEVYNRFMEERGKKNDEVERTEEEEEMMKRYIEEIIRKCEKRNDNHGKKTDN
jgi:predicted RNA-binding Zn-ribbon protein involved in translation (DUF1610 family)